MEQTQRKNVFSLQLNMHFTQTCNRWFHEAVVDVQYKNHAIKQWFPAGEEFLPGEEFHEFKGGISTLY